MKKLIVMIMILICAGSLNAQNKKDMRIGGYSAKLYSVESNTKTLALDTLSSFYEDSLIKIKWSYGVTSLDFELTNKANSTLKIIWDDAAFISITNESDKIFHKGIKYIDRENSQSPTSIYKNTTLSDLISPTSYSRFISGQYGRWHSDPIIPYKVNVWSAKKSEYLPDLIGKTIQVILPIKIEDKTNDYIFSFRTEFKTEVSGTGAN